MNGQIVSEENSFTVSEAIISYEKVLKEANDEQNPSVLRAAEKLTTKVLASKQ